MSMIGMEVGAVRNLASQLNTSAGQIEELMSRLTGVLEGTTWVGNDASQFRNEWQGGHVPALRGVAEALRSAATAASRNADAQEQASNT